MKTGKLHCICTALLIVLLGSTQPIAAQTTIYTTNFGTTANVNPPQWTFTGLNMNISTSSPRSSGYTGASGQCYLAEGNSQDFTNTSGTFFSNSQPGISTATLLLNTSGYTSVAVSFGMRKSNGYSNDVAYSLQWSSDNVTYTPVTFTEPAAGGWGLASGSGLNLPAGAGNQSTLYLKWTFNRTGPNYGLNFRLDDFRVIGNAVTCTGPAISSVSNNSPICSGNNLNLSVSASGTGPISYSWTGPNSFSSSTQNPAVSGATIAASGTYTVTAANGCGSASATTSVTVNSLPTVTANATANTVCAGASVTLTSNGATSYVWSGGVSNGVPFSPSSTATYTVTGSDINSCASTASMTVTVNPLPAMPVITAGDTTTFCQGDSVMLTSSSSNGYLWLTGETSPSITVDTSGNYFVTITDVNGCTASSAPINVIVHPLPSTAITADGPTSFCPGNSVTLTVTGAESYLWSTGATTQSIFVDTTGTYTITVTDVNGCTNNNSASPAIVTIVTDPTDINRDGITNNADFLLLLGQFNNNCALCREDINGDGVVNNADFLVLLGRFNMTCQD